MIFRRKTAGVTLPEVMIAIAILGMTMGLAKLGVDWMVALGRQRAMLNAQWQAQVVLYELTRNVRNAKQIVAVSSNSLTLSVFRPGEEGGFADPTFIVNSATGTIEYTFVDDGGETYLRRRYFYPDPADASETTILTRDTKLLVNMLVKPEGANWMFSPFNWSPGNAYDAVSISLRLRPAFMSASKYPDPIRYDSISMKRTSG